MKASQFITILMFTAALASAQSSFQHIQILQGFFNQVIQNPVAQDSETSCLGTINAVPSTIEKDVVKLSSSTLEKDDLQSTIRAIREIGDISVQLKTLLTNECQKQTAAIEAFTTWAEIFEDRAAFDYKIFKHVAKQYKQIQAELRTAYEAYRTADYSGLGQSLAKAEAMVVGNPTI